ncbi:hypothetical protein [Planomicrobium sp. CPCC 101079]|uniref:hypothetical protein n=1 Tax=Planomicrobium sp. CPCC 101079 TaxID=2599618 RepID=UPI0011B4522C|nr:hypothetical protein [Planomicrobium sp. CPCC 101079]TWT04687.1 hypothetical protein FQV28_08785 [Planomicrobium sp. CPCC 101079]
MCLQEKIIFTSDLAIIDADCKKDDVIVLLKGRGENIVRLNGNLILTSPTGHSKIRFTKAHFCLLNDLTLSFYKLTGEFVSKCDVGNDLYELFPYREGILCIYGDEGVFGEKIGKNRLNYASPFQKPDSYHGVAVQNNLLYEALFARYKPHACLSFKTNELLFLNDQLEREKTMEVPFETGNVLAFALTHEFGVFIEENKLKLWGFETTGHVLEYPGTFSHNTRAIFHRHEFLFLAVSDHEVRSFKPLANIYP